MNKTSEVTPGTDEENVKRGATLLDEHKPDWTEHVNLDIFDVSSPYNCAVGQNYGGFIEGLKALGLCDKDHNYTTKEETVVVEAHGFCAGGHSYLWVKEIKDRLPAAV